MRYRNGESVRTDLKNVDLIVWNEAVRCPRYCINAVDCTMRDLARSREPLAGKVVVFSGDFRQFISEIKGGSRAQIVHACVKISPVHRQFRTSRLSKNRQLTALRNYSVADADVLSCPNFLSALREGHVSRDEEDCVTLP